MTTTNTNIEKLITSSLTVEERKYYDELGEQHILNMIWGLFRGKNKWLMYLMNIMTLMFFGLFIVCILQFFKAETNFEMMKWSAGSIIFLIGICMLKIFTWMHMDKNALFRELTRLKIQVSSLSNRLIE